MSIKQLILPLGISILTFAVLGIYFHCRQRINTLENKMNVLFQLIQQHTALSQEQQPVEGYDQHKNATSLIDVSDDENSNSECSDSDDSEVDTSDEEDGTDDNGGIDNIKSIDISNTIPIISLNNVTATLLVNKLESVSSKSSLSNLEDLEDLEDLEEQLSDDNHIDSIPAEVRAELNAVNYGKFTVPKLKELVDKFGLVKSSGKLKRAQLINILDTAKL